MRKKDLIIFIWSILSGIILIFLILFLIGYIFSKGIKVVTLEFIFDIPKGEILGQAGGIAPAIIGSMLSSSLATIISAILALGTAIYLNFYEKNKRNKNIVSFIIRCIGGIPSIVLGLFGYIMFTLYFGFGRSIISGSLTLAIMIFFFFLIRIDKLFKEVDKNLLFSSYSLGIPKSYTIINLILKTSKDKILSILGLGYAYSIGATAPIMFCMAVINSPVSLNITKPSMTLSYHLYMLMTQGISYKMAYGTASVLLLIVIMVFIFSTFIGERGR